MNNIQGIFLEAFYTGSHSYFAQNLVEKLPYSVELFTLPGRHWKWRMHEAAISFSNKIDSARKPDFLITTDMTDLAVLKGLTKKLNGVPTVLYMHENQITYPWSPEDRDVELKRNHHYGFINYTSMLSADIVVFNSFFHLHSVISELTSFLSMFPDNHGLENVAKIRDKSIVIYPGIDVPLSLYSDSYKSREKPMRKNVVWNHRWEYDKQAEVFFDCLMQLKNQNIDFGLIILGEHTQSTPPTFNNIRQLFAENIVHIGYCESREEYLNWLRKGDILPVTSRQDFFGISAVEGIAYGLLPLLPNRLAFPEHIPEDFHSDFLYQSEEDLIRKLRFLLTNPLPNTSKLSAYVVDKYSWKKTIQNFAVLIDKITAQ